MAADPKQLKLEDQDSERKIAKLEGELEKAKQAVQDAQKQLNETKTMPRAADKKPVVVGLYGVPGSGKTYLLNQLKQAFVQEPFTFYDSSDVIAAIVPGGLVAFKKLEEIERVDWRQKAIVKIGRECRESGRVGVVAGHFMFWAEGEDGGVSVDTEADWKTYTHVLYLDVSPETIVERRRDDTERERSSESIVHISKWKDAEKTKLRQLCRGKGVLFMAIPGHRILLDTVSELLRDFRLDTEKYNLSKAEAVLDADVVAGQTQLKTMLVMDGDKTLAAEDAGMLFWKKVSEVKQSPEKGSTLKTLFESDLKYSYAAFRQAVLLCEEATDETEYERFCEHVASNMPIRPELLALLKLAAGHDDVGALVVTSGLRRVWQMVLERAGLSKSVRVIGGGRITDDLVVTAAVKGALVTRLCETYQMRVCAFGDSPLDIEMLCKADQAIVVVGGEAGRSKSMDDALETAIDMGGLRASQLLLPSDVSPRLDTIKLPVTSLMERECVELLSCRYAVRILHATNSTAAKLLMSSTRDATVAGPVLRERHHHIGQYLATHYVTKVVGLEEYPISHVQNKPTAGHRLLHESKTAIVALMRGGEPMALGVSDTFPLAAFVHAREAEEIQEHHVRGLSTIILVDSVVNTGKSVVEFVDRIRSLHATVRIVLVAGVVQAEVCNRRGRVYQALARHGRVSLVALRLSENKYTGSGTTDTGNRLFNTTHLA